MVYSFLYHWFQCSIYWLASLPVLSFISILHAFYNLHLVRMDEPSIALFSVQLWTCIPIQSFGHRVSYVHSSLSAFVLPFLAFVYLFVSSIAFKFISILCTYTYIFLLSLIYI